MSTATIDSLELSPEDVRRVTEPATLGFESTAQLSVPADVVGQQRALESIDFAFAIEDQNYNLYVSGEPGSGRSTSVQRAVEQAIKGRAAPADWCYVHHYDRPGEPMALSLPSGSAPSFARAVDACVIGSRRELRRAFAGEGYRSRRMQVVKDLSAQRDQALETVQHDALALGFVIQETPVGLAIIPLKRAAPAEIAAHIGADGKSGAPQEVSAGDEPMTPLEFESLPPEEQQRLSAARDVVHESIARTLPQLSRLDEEARARVEALDESIARQVVTPLIDALTARYSDSQQIIEWARHMEDDIVAHADVLRALDEVKEKRASGGSEGSRAEASPTVSSSADEQAQRLDTDEDLRERPDVAVLLRRYRVNVLVSHAERGTAPIVREMNPTYANLVGHIEFGLREGLPFTDHLMLKSGAFHRANGGYLILQARDLFVQPRAWEAVKRMLRFGAITLETGEDVGMMPASASLRPEPIPLRVKSGTHR